MNVLSLTLSCNSIVAIGAFNCPFATITWNSSGLPSFNFVCRTSNRNLRILAPGKALEKAHVSMSPSICNSPKSIGTYSILRLLRNSKFVDSGRNLVSPSGDTWSFENFGRQ